MKKQISKLILLMVPLMLLFSCNKDKFSEKDALNAQQTVDLLVTVIDASTSMAPVDSATVILVSDSTIVTKTTNSNGIVVFPGIKIGGEATVSVSKTDFTSVLTTVYTNPASYRQTQVSTIVNLYSIDPTKMATFQGRLTMQSDLTNRKREPAAGVTVKASNGNLNYTGQLFTAVTDADGKYSIAVPVSSNGDNITLFYPDFTANQTLAIVKPDNSVGVVTRSVLYRLTSNTPLGDLNDILAIPSVYATVAAPPAVTGSGFALSSKANRVALSTYSSVTLIDGGSGYNGGVSIAGALLTFSADPNGLSAQLSVNITNGRITSINSFVNNGATYATAPTLNLSGLAPTTPAVISLNFQTTYKIYISNRGTSYNTFPLVSVETETYSSGTLVKAVDPNINDNSTVNLGTSTILNGFATIYGGVIKGVTNADTLVAATVISFASAPVFTVVNTTSKPATLSVNTNSVNADSTLNSITVASAGSGYNPDAPPVVTLTTLAGYGSGAVAKATVNTSGAVSAIFITNPGVKYVKNVNDFRKDFTVTPTFDYPYYYPTTNYNGVKPGDVNVQDVYYGTGYQVLNQSTGK